MYELLIGGIIIFIGIGILFFSFKKCPECNSRGRVRQVGAVKAETYSDITSCKNENKICVLYHCHRCKHEHYRYVFPSISAYVKSLYYIFFK